MQDKEYIQPENDTIDWLVYAEYVAYQLRQISQDVKDVIESDGQGLYYPMNTVLVILPIASEENTMKNVHVYDILSEDGETLIDLIIPMDIGYEWMDVFEKVQATYLDNVESYSYTEI